MEIDAMTEYQDLMKVDRRKALRKATEEFVSYFFYRIFKEMWDSIPKSGLIPETNGQKFFRDMMIYEYSKRIASQDASGLTNLILKSLGKEAYNSRK